MYMYAWPCPNTLYCRVTTLTSKLCTYLSVLSSLPKIHCTLYIDCLSHTHTKCPCMCPHTINTRTVGGFHSWPILADVNTRARRYVTTWLRHQRREEIKQQNIQRVSHNLNLYVYSMRNYISCDYHLMYVNHLHTHVQSCWLYCTLFVCVCACWY